MITLRNFFNLGCFLTAFVMTTYWLYMFVMDEDLVQMSLKTTEKITEDQYPMVSFCFNDPIIESKLKHYNDELTAMTYKEILKGEMMNFGLDSIDFDDVTLNLKDFYLEDTIAFRNGSYEEGIYPNSLHEIPRVTYSGFYDGELVKCYGLRSKYTDLSYSSFRFNSSMFPNGVRSTSSMLIIFHLPNKFSLAGNSVKLAWPERNTKKEHAMTFWLQQVEIVKRRNKNTNPCILDSSNYDDMVFDDHFEEVGCSVPYQKRNETLRECESMEEFRRAKYDVIRKKKSKLACTTTASIIFTFEEEDYVWKGSDWFHIYIMHPHHIKEIVMVKAVTIQTAIGNAGGYIGLFIGYAVMQIPDYLVHLHNYLKKWAILVVGKESFK